MALGDVGEPERAPPGGSHEGPTAHHAIVSQPLRFSRAGGVDHPQLAAQLVLPVRPRGINGQMVS